MVEVGGLQHLERARSPLRLAQSKEFYGSMAQGLALASSGYADLGSSGRLASWSSKKGIMVAMSNIMVVEALLVVGNLLQPSSV